jgi:rhamnulokinase
MTALTVAAVDLGASSGRVMLAVIDPSAGPTGVTLHEVHRFPNEPVALRAAGRTGLHWDIVGMYRQVIIGLRRAAEQARRLGLPVPASIGIDSWAVDYGLLGADGCLLGTPYCYRDERGRAGVAAVHTAVSASDLYAVNGLQQLPFTTVYQLAAERDSPRWSAARTMLLLPDLLAYWLTGEVGAEVTNASTTGLIDVHSGQWATGLAEQLGIPAPLLPPLRVPGERIGTLLPDVARDTGLPPSTVVTAVGSHDTASAVVGVPATEPDFAYIACGTWALVGTELPGPVLGEASRAANFTNETGVDGRIRFLRNVMGLWLLDESRRAWDRAGAPAVLADLLDAASRVPDGGPVIDPDEPRFLAPGDMPSRIAQACLDSGQAVPADRPALVRCILDSLAAAFARAVADVERLTARTIPVVHLVGGGSRNRLLCRLTARATGLTVLAGPVEATALGNALVQARALGATGTGLADLRALIARAPLDRYLPETVAIEEATG